MYVGVFCFFVTSIFECFIRLDYIPQQTGGHVLQIIKHDLKTSTYFICRIKPSILKTLLLVTVTAFFVQGVALVGLPFIIRTVLGLNAGYYGAAESILGLAGLAGSVIAGIIATKFRSENLNLPHIINWFVPDSVRIDLLSPCGRLSEIRNTDRLFCFDSNRGLHLLNFLSFRNSAVNT